MGKIGEKWIKVGKSGEKRGKVGKSWEKWEKVGKSGEKLEEVGKSREKWEKCFFLILDKMSAGGHFGCPKITFDHSSCHFRFFFEIFGQNGRRRPFWIGRQCQLSNSSEIFG